MDHLLNLLTAQKAKLLQFRAGRPPIVVLDDEERALQGPPISGEEVVQLLREVATFRQMQDLRDSGEAQFIYTAIGRTPFLIHAKIEGENVLFEVS